MPHGPTDPAERTTSAARARRPAADRPPGGAGGSLGSDARADLAAIDALVDRLVPALTARLGATHLGELEVREGDWRIRLRRPPTAGGWNGEARRAADRHLSPGRAPAEAHRVATAGGPNGTNHPGSGPAHVPAVVTAPAGGRAGAGLTPTRVDDHHRVATSPAVGVFRPGARATVGARVREGDPIGHVDVLGVREDVLSPVDGLVGEVLIEAGTAVEYGQELVVIALAATPAGTGEGR